MQNTSATSSCQLLDHSVVLRLWERWPVIIGVTHHHPQLHRLGDGSPIGTLNHNTDQELTNEKEQRRLFHLPIASPAPCLLVRHTCS